MTTHDCTACPEYHFWKGITDPDDACDTFASIQAVHDSPGLAPGGVCRVFAAHEAGRYEEVEE